MFRKNLSMYQTKIVPCTFIKYIAETSERSFSIFNLQEFLCGNKKKKNKNRIVKLCEKYSVKPTERYCLSRKSDIYHIDTNKYFNYTYEYICIY